MLGKLIELRNNLQPKLKNNYDINLFDYSFWTDLEKLAAKQRGKSKDVLMIDAAKDRENGVVLKGGTYQLVLSTVSVASFDKDKFIDEAAKLFDIDKHKLRELSMNCNKSSQRKTYTVEEVDG